MKHLLILLISILLLSSPVIGDNHTLPVSGGKGVTLYEWKTSSGKVWKYFGDNKIHTRYEGEVENGVPNGLGIMIYPRLGLRVKFFTGYYYFKKYIGSWKNGKEWNGKGYDPKGYYLLKFVNGERMSRCFIVY